MLGLLALVPGAGLAMQALSTVAAVWRALPLVVKIGLGLVVAFGIGFWRGERRADIRCNARIEKSIADAKAIDARVSAEARQTAEQQAREAEQRAAEAEAVYVEFAKQATDRLGDCQVGADAAARINLPDGGVHPAGPRRLTPHPAGRR